MNRLGILVVLAAVLGGCSTSAPALKESGGGGAIREKDMSREYSVSLEELVEACVAALKDVGADYHHEPLVKMEKDSPIAAIVAGSSRTRVYGVTLWPEGRRIGVTLMIDDRETPGSRAPYDEFWAALEARL